MIDLLRLCLEPVLLRRRSLRRLLRLAAAMVLGAGLNAVLGWAGCGGGWTPVGILAGIALLLSLAEKFEPGPDYVAVAREVESRHPELHALLRTAVEQQPDPGTGQLGYLQGRVVSEAVAECRRRNLAGVVAGWKLGAARTLSAPLQALSPAGPPRRAARPGRPSRSAPPARAGETPARAAR